MDKMDIEFRKCTRDDLTYLVQISKSTFCEAFEADNDPEDFNAYMDSAFSTTQLQKELSQEHTTFYFVIGKGQVLGYFKLNEFDAQSEFHEVIGIELERVYITSGYQGKGIGRQVLNQIFEIAKTRKKHYVWLGVWQRNPRAIKFYEAYGFQKIGTHPYFIGNDKQTDWLMRKEV